MHSVLIEHFTNGLPSAITSTALLALKRDVSVSRNTYIVLYILMCINYQNLFISVITYCSGGLENHSSF